ncbi:hypothetical protein P7K49_006852 [Saguinus oedipus]|uniref:Uncharacterized protein n=1 Tax=Saguinus oedipus TaxID=9490 RepID=A0ABQ9W4D6_SAGOE|nr:hypothetical protein P7K49_006852 [Saguinus oedipus]
MATSLHEGPTNQLDLLIRAAGAGERSRVVRFTPVAEEPGSRCCPRSGAAGFFG